MDSSVIQTLVENAKYMPQNNDNDNDSSESGSACESKCQTQQAGIVSCMSSIRDAREKGNDSNDTNACLAPSVAAWTECCARANDAPPPTE